MTEIRLPGATLTWVVPPESWAVADATLTASAAARTDIFSNPLGGKATNSAARALTRPPAGDWQLQARIAVGFRASWDAGALLVWADEQHWAKVNFELAPDGTPSIFSVVTRRGRSDDAVGWPAITPDHWLRVSHLDGGFAFHSSADGRRWRLVRQFHLEEPGPVRVGLIVQSPVGEGCSVTFDDLALTPTRLTHLFDGG
jgi:regulation of enolase protein 1 (concanavalin A-like superfamily)